MRCPNCAEELPADTDRCPACGDDLGAFRDSTPGAPGRSDQTRSAGGDDRRAGDDWGSRNDRRAGDRSGGATEGPGGTGATDGTAAESDRNGWGSPSDGRTTGTGTTPAGRGTDRGSTSAGEPVGAPVSGHPSQGSPFELGLKYPFSRGWRTTGGWTLAFWAVFIGLLAVAVVSAGVSGDAEAATGTLATAVLVLGPLPYLGYLLRTSRAAARGEPRAPAFGGLRENVLLGLRALAGFMAVQFLAVLPLLPVLLLAGEQPSSGVALGIGLLLLVVVALVGYLVPAFLTVLAVTGSLRTAFGTRRVAEFAFTTEYFVASLLGFVLLIVLRLLAVLSVLTIVGWILLVPYAFVAVAAYWGEVYREQMGDPGDGPSTGDGPAPDGRAPLAD